MQKWIKWLLFYCLLSEGPFCVINLDPMHEKELKKENKAWPKCTVLLISLFSQMTLYQLNFALGKLPLNKVHRNNFPVLKPIFMLKLH